VRFIANLFAKQMQTVVLQQWASAHCKKAFNVKKVFMSRKYSCQESMP